MIASILAWFASGGIAAIGKQLNEAYARKLSAKNNADRLETERQIATLEAQQAVLLAEQRNWLTRWIRPAFALPFVIYDAKVVIWDKVLEWGSTDPLSPEFHYLQIAVFGAYFFNRHAEKQKWK